MKYTVVTVFAAFALFQASDAFVPRTLPTDLAVRSLDCALRVVTDVDGVQDSLSGSPKQETTVAAVPKVAQRWRKSTKQLVTLGPASSSRAMIETLFLAGADLFRLNFSHGSQEQKKELLMTIREIEEKYAHPIGILGDLQGPKLRVSHLGHFFVCSFSCGLINLCCTGWGILESNRGNSGQGPDVPPRLGCSQRRQNKSYASAP